MERSPHTVTVLEHCSVSPPPDAVPVNSLPLNFFDLIWLTFHPLGRVILYDFPHSTAYFTQSVVPNLKTSLSLALKHFTPLAGKLITPSDNDSKAECQIRYLDGDSVSVTFAECTKDFNHFFGNHVRDATVLKPLVPQLSSATCIDISGEKCSASPVLAVKVTVFPNTAICIGITNSHVVADGNTMFNFVRAWASIAKQLNIVANDKLDIDGLVSSGCFQIPVYDRSLIKDPYNLGPMFVKVLGTLMEQILKMIREKEIAQDSSNRKVKATLVITEANIKALKNMLLIKRPTLTYVSSFTVVCAYLWTCFAKTRAIVHEKVHDLDEAQNFGFVMDSRARLDPPLPASYFGNCLVPCGAVETGRVMVGDEGLVRAVELFGDAISLKLNKGPLYGSDKWMDDFGGIARGEWNIGIAGSPKLDYYNTVDFGWGKALKFEFENEPLSLSRCKDSKNDIEVGLVLPKNEIEVFSTIFAQGLQSLHG